jgi:hypothetical protein
MITATAVRRRLVPALALGLGLLAPTAVAAPSPEAGPDGEIIGGGGP